MEAAALKPATHLRKGKPPATRLYALLARGAQTGVIFRRGPSKLVQLIGWDLRTDTFDHGQWFKGRIYERRCDLSPSGKLLVYFAATNRGPYGSWTALSRPPFFTALALWPKGDAWGGGGMFESEQTLRLNHSPDNARGGFELAEGFRLKPRMKVIPFGQWSGRGEDEPINTVVRQRDGWRVVDAGEGAYNSVRADTLYTFSRPRITEKDGKNGRRLQAVLNAVGRRNAAWYSVTHRVLDRDENVLVDLPKCDWADWDGGDLLFARDGCVYRLRKNRIGDYATQGDAACVMLNDFRDATFKPVAPTPDALRY